MLYFILSLAEKSLFQCDHLGFKFLRHSYSFYVRLKRINVSTL